VRPDEDLRSDEVDLITPVTSIQAPKRKVTSATIPMI
jgi:hypothetical protein